MVTILQLSVGSLLGHNILDALEGRRDRVRVVGLNTIAASPSIFRCDRAYRAPLAADGAFIPFLRSIISTERPDIVLPGRDGDLLPLATLAKADPSLRGRMPIGSAAAAEIVTDKVATWRFAAALGLPFADSFALDDSNPPASAMAWAASRYPILAKPRSGSGSKGIRILCSEAHLAALLARGGCGVLLQQVVDFGEARWREVEAQLASIECGVPLSFDLHDPAQYTGQALIGPDGEVRRVLASISGMSLGHPVSVQACDDPGLSQLVHDYARALADAGWRGLFNLQCRRGATGYVVTEIAGRMSGSTSARRWLGFDELRETILAFAGRDIGPDPRGTAPPGALVLRAPSDFLVPRDAIAAFERDGRWEPSRATAA